MSITHPYAVPVRRRSTARLGAATPTRVALIGGFKPTKCGLATFTTDVYEQMSAWLPGTRVDVYAMVPSAAAPIAAEVTATILQHDRRSYVDAAKRLNASDVDVVWIQHEFGIYGGECGEMILELVDAVAAPVIVTLHTVLHAPSVKQRGVIERLMAKASKFVVMSVASRDILISSYGIEPLRVHVVEHGAPDRAMISPQVARATLGLTDRPTVMTFGLLGPGKGLEIAIRALPDIVRAHPDVVYRIVGATHPNLVATEGEAYRNHLKALAVELGVDRSIEWVEAFLDTDDLLDQLASCDIYLTPYLNLAQSTSGTLSYAVALGCAVVSTPYVHARELLADGVGVLVPPDDPVGIAAAVNNLLSDAASLAMLKSNAYKRGRRTIWSVFAARSGTVIDDVLRRFEPARGATKPVMPSTDAFLSLVDDVGILQHSVGVVPDRHHGYCIDDNARALILVNQLGHEFQRLAPRFAAFLQHGWNDDARRFRNFMSYDRRWLEPVGSEDSNGRTLWAVGHAAHKASDPRVREWATALFNRASPHLQTLKSPRAMAFLILGAHHILAVDKSNISARGLVARCVEEFGALPLHRTDKTDDWMWFEEVLSYDNARIPQALFALGAITGEARFTAVATEQLTWLCNAHTSHKGMFRPVGSDGFHLRQETRPFDQQPLEAWAMIDACVAAMAANPSETWAAMAQRAYSWYLGMNDRGIPVGDPRTGSCCDGLMAHGLNANTGAESVLSFSLAYQALIRLAGSHEESRSPPHQKLGSR